MQQLFARLDQGLEALIQFTAKSGEIDDFRQPPLFTQGLQYFVLCRPVAQPAIVQAPHIGIGPIDEAQPPFGVENRNAGPQLFQHLLMRTHVRRKFILGSIQSRQIFSKARNSPKIIGAFAHLKKAAVATKDG